MTLALSVRPVFCLLALSFFTSIFAGCALTRAAVLPSNSTIDTPDFAHRVIELGETSPVLHVYIEGDGRPWLSRRMVAADPTPRRAMMLKLMKMDSTQSLYLGRPCYFQTEDNNCNALWWTQLRYSKRVVESMNAALDLHLAVSQQVVLIGHSGGATLAMLMAEKRNDVVAVVTLAGNLDVNAWAEQHGYSPLQGSLNPADSSPLRQEIKQLHYLGTHDRTISKAIIEPVVERQFQAQLTMVEGADHRCCWEENWPKVLRIIP